MRLFDDAYAEQIAFLICLFAAYTDLYGQDIVNFC